MDPVKPVQFQKVHANAFTPLPVTFANKSAGIRPVTPLAANVVAKIFSAAVVIPANRLDGIL